MFETRIFDLIVPSDDADLEIYEFDRQTGQDLGFLGLTAHCSGPVTSPSVAVAA